MELFITTAVITSNPTNSLLIESTSHMPEPSTELILSQFIPVHILMF
jgi:hypothetical protein